jgi:preprotein translocase subunit YajC
MNYLLGLFVFAQESLGGSAPAAPVAGGEAAATGGAADAAQSALGCGGGGDQGMGFIIWMVLLFALMYFMLIRPQKKQRDAHQKLITSLKKGDRVATSGGILGTIYGITDNTVQVEVADGVKIKVQKAHVTGLQTDPVVKK